MKNSFHGSLLYYIDKYVQTNPLKLRTEYNDCTIEYGCNIKRIISKEEDIMNE